MAPKQARKCKQFGTPTGVESAHRRVRQATPAIGEGGDVGSSHSTALGYLINSSDCINLREVAREYSHLRVHHATPAIEAGDAVPGHDAACMMDLTPQHQSLIPTASHSGNFQPMGAAHEEGPAQPAIVLPPVGPAQLQGEFFAINANIAMPPAPPVQEYHNAVLTGAPNLAADQDMIYAILHIMHEGGNFQPMGAAQEEGPAQPAIVLPPVGPAQLQGEFFAINANIAMPPAPPVQENHNAVLTGAPNLAADQDMIYAILHIMHEGGNFQPMGAAQEGPAQPAIVLPPVGPAQLQGEFFAINANISMPPAPPVQEYHNAVLIGAPNLAADQDMIYAILHIMHEGGNFQPMGAAQEEGPAQPAIVLPPVGPAQLQGEFFAINANIAMPPAPPVQEYHNAVLTGAPNLAADQDMIYAILHIMHEGGNFQPMGAAQEEGLAQPAIVLRPVGAAQIQGEFFAINANIAMPPASPVQEYHNAVLTGAPNLAADQDMIYAILHIMHEGGNFQPMGAAQEEGPAQPAIVLRSVGAAQIQGEFFAINANIAMPPAPPVQEYHNTVRAGALNLGADEDMNHLIPLPQVPAALDLEPGFEPGFIEWKNVNLRDDTLQRESTKEFFDFDVLKTSSD